MAVDIDLNNPKTQKMLALGLFLIIALYLIYTFMVSPQSEQISQLKQNRDSLDQEVRKLIRIKKLLPEKKEEIKSKRQEIEIIKDYLPSNPGYHKLLKDLSEMLNNSNLILQSMNFGKLKTKQDFSQFPITLSVEGTYHNLGGFLSSISKLPRIVNVGEITLNSINEEDSNSTVKVRLELLSYVSKTSK